MKYSISALIRIVLMYSMVIFTTQSISAQCSLACNGSTQVSLNSMCQATITVDMILNDQASSCPGAGRNFMVVVSDDNGPISTSPVVNGNYINQTLTVQVIETTSGNSCWGFIEIEDKLAPSLDCPVDPIVIDCIEMNSFEGPSFTDACEGNLTPILVSESVNTLCDPDNIKEIIRTYSGVDSRGNVANNTCDVRILLERIDPDRINFPDSLVIQCDSIPDFDTNGNGKIDQGEVVSTMVTGVPTYTSATMGNPIVDLFPFPDAFCNTIVTFTDTVLPRIGCRQKILRRWSVSEWHCNAEVLFTNVQLIEIVDTTPPNIVRNNNFECVFNGLTSITLTTNTLLGSTSSQYGDVTCGASVILPLPEGSDNCGDLSFDITHNTGLIQDFQGTETIVLPMGTNVVLYTVYDECLNSSTCHASVDIVDTTPPIAVCDQNTVVGLTSNGTAEVNASSFDDGSYDDCRLQCQLVRRMDNGGNCGCRAPSICNLDLLGEFNGSYYYLSTDAVGSPIAKQRAEAYGGTLVIFDTPAEEDYVVQNVRRTFSDRFWIGAKRTGNTYEWDDHSRIIYSNFRGDTIPVVTGNDCVMVTPMDVWNGTANCSSSQRYVVELPTGACTFSESASFCCDDVALTEQMVVFRVVDFYGNFNDCMVNVNVQDKSVPTLNCPPDRTVDCTFRFDPNALYLSFGTLSMGENCSATIDSSFVDNIDECGVGTIVRTYNALSGLVDPVILNTCKQTITFINDHPFDNADIVCPPQEITINGCSDPSEFMPDIIGGPEFLGDQCDLLAADFRDDVFTFNNGSGANSCFKILREWSIINWCQTDAFGVSSPFRCNQVIKVNNLDKPIVSGVKDLEICTFDSDCATGFVELEVSAEDDCTLAENLSWSYSVFAGALGLGPSSFTDPVASASGTGNVANASAKYPIGSHVIRWTFNDRCGNSTTVDQRFTVVNCSPPLAYCINGLAVSLMPRDSNNDGIADDGIAEVWANDFDAGSTHPCGFPVMLSFSPDTQQSNISFDCGDLGNQEVIVYSYIQTATGMRVQSSCSTFIDIQNNNNACTPRRDVIVQGSIKTEEEQTIENVEVTLDGSNQSVLTDNNGHYAFPNMPIGGEYVVSPYSNDDPLHGVSTHDLILIQRHILGIETLNSPYKIIAADIDNSGSINGIDLLELRKLILGINDAFPDNDSWRFVDRSYAFNDPLNPFSDALPSDYSINSLDTDMNIDFVGIKTGDVNNSVTFGRAVTPITGHAISVGTEEFSSDTELYTIPITLDNAVNGIQLSLDFSDLGGYIIDATANVKSFGHDNYSIQDNVVNISWNNDNERLETINLIVDGTRIDATELKLSDSMQSEIYDGNVYDVVLENINDTYTKIEKLVLLQNTPNPFEDFTTISFFLPKDDVVTLTITDIQGKILYTLTDNYGTGENNVTLSSEKINGNGIVYLNAKTSTDIQSIKMINIK